MHTTKFHHGPSNLPELFLFDSSDPLHCLTTHLKDSLVQLKKEDELKFFSHLSSKDLTQLINAPQLTVLEKEHMHYHHKLKRLSPKNTARLIDIGILPSQLKLVKPPPCLACLLGKSKKKPWRSKSTPPNIRRSSVKPGHAVSVDQLTSTTPGLKLQSIGHLTKATIVGAQVFADHSSSPPFLYAHLLENFSLDETLKAKVAFERMAATCNNPILRYRADNGRFADEGFIQACTACNQTIDFCGVNAHFQNGIAESNIGFIQQSTRTILLHAMRNWPEMIALELWTLDLLEATRLANLTRFDVDGRVPISQFSNSNAIFNVADEHTFGCPVCVLDDSLQSGSSIPKWNSRVRVGAYVGKSPFHAQSVSLIMNVETGLISPQCHCLNDDKFTTVASIRKGIEPPNWNKLIQTAFPTSSTSDFMPSLQWDITQNNSKVHTSPISKASLLGSGVSNPVSLPSNATSEPIPFLQPLYEPSNTQALPKLQPLSRPSLPKLVPLPTHEPLPILQPLSPSSKPSTSSFDSIFPYRSYFDVKPDETTYSLPDVLDDSDSSPATFTSREDSPSETLASGEDMLRSMQESSVSTDESPIVPMWKLNLLPASDDEHNEDEDTIDSDSISNDPTESSSSPIPRRSARTRFPIKRLNLATWICFLSSLPQQLEAFKHNQIDTLNAQQNYEI